MEHLESTPANGSYINHGFVYDSDATEDNGDVKTAKVQKYTNLDKKDQDNTSPLIREIKQAIDSNDIDLINRKVKENPDIINKISSEFSHDRNSTTLLFYAISQNKLEAVKELIASGANVNAMVGKDKRTAIHQACYLKDTKILEEILKESSRHINTPVKSFTPLYIAIHTGDVKKVELLINYGAAINIFSEHLKDAIGLSPLAYAVSTVNIPIITLLLKNGADEKKGTHSHFKGSLKEEETVVKAIARYPEMFANVTLSPDDLREKKLEILELLSSHEVQ